jgi:hypothetical protein
MSQDLGGFAPVNPLGGGGGYQPSYSPQLNFSGLTIGDAGSYRIPYSSKIKIVTGANFSIDQREKIYFKDDDRDKKNIILFYREKDIVDKVKLLNIQKVFITTASIDYDGTIFFKVCNLSADTELNDAFNEVIKTKAHPFNWIKNAADENIFILIYNSGYPQMFYEGPLEPSYFSNFINAYLKPELSYLALFQKESSGNGFLLDRKTNYIQQTWSRYVPTGSAVGNVATALIKDENLPAGIRAVVKGEYIGTPPFVKGASFPSQDKLTPSDPKFKEGIKYKKTKVWAEKINQIYKNDNRKNIDMAKPEAEFNNIPLVSTGSNPNLISEAFNTSQYIDYLIIYTGKNPDDQIKNYAKDVYEISKQLYIYKNAFGLTTKDVATLAINMYGFYKFKEVDPSVKSDTADALSSLYMSQNVISKLVNINPIFVQQIASIVSKIIIGESRDITKNVKTYLDNNRGQDKKEADYNDVTSIVIYFQEKMDEYKNNDDNKNKSENDIKKILIDDVDEYMNTQSDESFPESIKSQDEDDKLNNNIQRLINDDTNIKRNIVRKILGDKQQQNQEKEKEDTVNIFGSYGGGGRRGRRG